MSAKRRRPKRRTLSERATDAPSPHRMHGDSYTDVLARSDDLGATASTHRPAPDRRPEEPSDAVVDGPERLEGDL